MSEREKGVAYTLTVSFVTEGLDLASDLLALLVHVICRSSGCLELVLENLVGNYRDGRRGFSGSSQKSLGTLAIHLPRIESPIGCILWKNLQA